jgi:hypothetical protein
LNLLTITTTVAAADLLLPLEEEKTVVALPGKLLCYFKKILCEQGKSKNGI